MKQYKILIERYPYINIAVSKIIYIINNVTSLHMVTNFFDFVETGKQRGIWGYSLRSFDRVLKIVNRIIFKNYTIWLHINRIVYPIPFASPDERLPVQAAMWSPGPRSSALVYCRQNDIYYIPDVTVDQTERLTSDGSFNGISNGIPDWTYRGKHIISKPLCTTQIR